MRELLERIGALSTFSSESERTEFESRLSALTAKRSFQVEDLAFRFRLSKNHLKVATLLEKGVNANDLHLRVADDAIVVVSPLLRPREARLKAARLRASIERTLADATLDLEELTIDSTGTVNAVPCPELDQLVSEIIAESEGASAAQATDFAAGATSDEERLPRGELHGIEYIHRPMLTQQTKIVSTFLVVPVRRVSPDRFQSGYSVLTNVNDPLEILELDQLTLRHTISELNYLMASGGRSLFSVPVHFETLANPRRARDYLHFGLEKLSGLEKRIVFEIVGLPGKIPQARLIELVGVLVQASRAVIARFESDCTDFMDYRSAGLHAVGIDIYSTPKRERVLLTEMSRFAEMARKGRLKSYIQGVRSLSMLTAAISAGFDYVAGHALGKPCLHAEDIRTFQLGDMYRSPPMADSAISESIVDLSAA